MVHSALPCSQGCSVTPSHELRWWTVVHLRWWTYIVHGMARGRRRGHAWLTRRTTLVCTEAGWWWWWRERKRTTWWAHRSHWYSWWRRWHYRRSSQARRRRGTRRESSSSSIEVERSIFRKSVVLPCLRCQESLCWSTMSFSTFSILFQGIVDVYWSIEQVLIRERLDCCIRCFKRVKGDKPKVARGPRCLVSCHLRNGA